MFKLRGVKQPLIVTSKPRKKDNDTMTMKFLLHKDNKRKESPPHIQAHLSLPDKKANASQSQKSLHFAFAPRQSKY